MGSSSLHLRGFGHSISEFLGQSEQASSPPGTIRLVSPTRVDRPVQVLEKIVKGGRGDLGTDIPLPSQ